MWGQVPTPQNTHCYCITKHKLVNAVSDTLAAHYENYTEQTDHTMWAECSVSNVTVGGPHSYHRPLTFRASTAAQFTFIPHIDPACQYEPNSLFLAHTKHKHDQKKRKRNVDFFSN
jgi:hypothetical protein